MSRAHFHPGINKADNSKNTVQFLTERDPETGHIHGIRISGCRACGRYPSTVMSASGFCGRQSCIKQRKKAKARAARAARGATA